MTRKTCPAACIFVDMSPRTVFDFAPSLQILRLKKTTKQHLMTRTRKEFQSKNQPEKKLEQKRRENWKTKKLARRSENLKKKSERRIRRFRKNGELNI